MSRSVVYHMALLVGIGWSLWLPDPARSDLDAPLACPGDLARTDEVPAIRPGMTLEQVNRLLQEKPFCFATGSAWTRPEDTDCWYLGAAVVVFYSHGTATRVQKFKPVPNSR